MLVDKLVKIVVCGIINWLICVVCVGIFNVGKLILLNYIVNKKIVKVGDCLGVIKG